MTVVTQFSTAFLSASEVIVQRLTPPPYLGGKVSLRYLTRYLTTLPNTGGFQVLGDVKLPGEVAELRKGRRGFSTEPGIIANGLH